MRYLLSFIFLTCVFAQIAFTQGSIREYVKKKTVPIRSIQPSDTSYDDLQAIGNAIGDARVVMLGEQDHGDAPAFLAKTRLVKYLHEKKGFNVLAFESDFLGLNYGWDAVSRQQPAIDSFLKKNIFTIWTACDACSELLYHYVPATHAAGNGLEVSGFDNQLILSYAAERIVPVLDSVFRALALPVVMAPGYGNRFLPMVNELQKGYGGKVLDTAFYAGLLTWLERARKEMKAQLPEDNFWVMIMDNLVSSTAAYRGYRIGNGIEAGNIRDAQMANNLSWLARIKYPNQKIIVWAANGHIAGNAFRYVPATPETKPMGHIFRKLSGSGIPSYILGFTSFSGTTGRVTMSNTYALTAPDDDGFERWIPASYQQSFTDFKAFEGRRSKSFSMKGFGHGPSDVAWLSIYDGVFFIRDMYPCKPSN